jgi:hypothetical protein
MQEGKLSINCDRVSWYRAGNCLIQLSVGGG